jgi:hypothetical protein
MDYEVLSGSSANDLKNRSDAKLIATNAFNFSKTYLLNDGSYLVMPLNPFGNSLHTSEKQELDNWISEGYFPSGDEANTFYLENRPQIDNLPAYQEKLKETLFGFVFKDDLTAAKAMDEATIEHIYEILKKKKKIKTFKLHFLVLLGDFIISKDQSGLYHWGKLSNKQLLNPIIKPVIVTNEEEQLYFDLEDSIYGKWGYVGVQAILHALASDMTKKGNEIETLISFA